MFLQSAFRPRTVPTRSAPALHVSADLNNYSDPVSVAAVDKMNEFLSTLSAPQPPALLSELFQSLWWDKKGDWDRAHSIAQRNPTVQGSAVHAYLHREEGVLWNADYWYSRAGRQRPDFPLEQEWENLVKELNSGM